MLTDKEFKTLAKRKFIRQMLSLKMWILLMMWCPAVYFFSKGMISDVLFCGLIGVQFIGAVSAHAIADRKFTEEEKEDKE